MASARLPLRPLISIAVMILCGIVANWNYSYVDISLQTTRSSAPNFIEDPVPGNPPEISAAGWPAKYLLNITYEDAPAQSVFSATRLVFNLAVWTLFTVAFVLYERRISRVLSRNNDQKRRLTIFDVLVLTAAIAASISYVRMFASASDREAAFVNEISPRGGSVQRLLSLPAPVVGLIERLHLDMYRYSRVTEVTLVDPSNEQVATALDFPYLRKLYIGGGNYDLRLLDLLATKPLLQELRISGRELDAQSIAAIGATKQLVAINLMRTNINALGVTALGEMPRLRILNLIHTDVEHFESGLPPCSKTVQYLSLPRPRKGGTGQIQLDGWPSLLQLEVNEFDELLNIEVVAVDLRNLPQLKTIALDSLQKFDLRLENLPELVEVTPKNSQWETRVAESQGIPDGLWLESVSVTRVPKLSEMRVFATDLEKCEFSTLSGLNLRLSASRKFFSAPLYGEPHARGARSTIPEDRVDAWLKSFSSSAGPGRLELRELSLKGVDFSCLAANAGMNALALTDCDVSVDDLLKLSDADTLRELDLTGCPVDGSGLAKLASQLPQLTKIICDRHRLGRLRLQDHPHLESIFSKVELPLWAGYFTPTDALQLVRLPALKEAFDLPPGAIFLHIEDAPSLTGLSLRSPLPDKSKLTGLRDLEYLSIGGIRVDDRLCETILACDRLSHLTLAYTNVSPEMLAKIRTLKNLRSLTLTGSRVDDDVIAKLSELTELRTLRLDQTAITDAALTFIANLRLLENLSLHDTKITAAGIEKLTVLPKLNRLALGNRSLTPDDLRSVGMLNSLKILDLAGAAISQDAGKALSESPPPALEIVGVRLATINEPDLIQLSKRMPSVKFELDEGLLSPAGLNILKKSEQWIVADDFDVIPVQAYESLPLTLENAHRPTERCDVDPRLFAPLPNYDEKFDVE